MKNFHGLSVTMKDEYARGRTMGLPPKVPGVSIGCRQARRAPDNRSEYQKFLGMGVRGKGLFFKKVLPPEAHFHRKVFACGFAAIVVLVVASSCWAGGPGGAHGPRLDPALMAFKELGVWYYPCVAPVYHHRIPPHYMTFGPPPPFCPPPLCGPVPFGPPPVQPKVK